MEIALQATGCLAGQPKLPSWGALVIVPDYAMCCVRNDQSVWDQSKCTILSNCDTTTAKNRVVWHNGSHIESMVQPVP
jgi:hypothetical protein